MYKSSDIAQKIKGLAKEKNVSISDMLQKIELGRNTMANFKTSMPKADNLAKIADYLECSVDYLLGRTDDPVLHTINNVNEIPTTINPPKSSKKEPERPKIVLPIYPQSVSAGTGSYLFDAEPEWINVEKNSKTAEVDFLVRVSGDSMLPEFHDGDVVLVKNSPSVPEGEIGIFYVDGDAFIKKMGNGELISLNPDYPNISIREYNSVHCFGQVIGILNE